MKATQKKHRPHRKVGKDAEEEDDCWSLKSGPQLVDLREFSEFELTQR